MSQSIEHELELERCLLGSLMRTPGVVALEDLDEEDFLSEDHRQLLNAIKSSMSDLSPINIANILRKTYPQRKDCMQFVMDVYEAGYARAGARSCFAEIKRRTQRRKLQAFFAQGLKRLEREAPGADPRALWSEFAAEFMRLAPGAQEGDVHQYDAKTMICAAIDEIERNVYGDIEESRVPSGLEALDERVGGFHNADLIIVGGRPAMGKTAMMVSCLMNVDAPVGVISTEMTAAQLGVRGIANQAAIPLYRLRRQGFLDDMEVTRINVATQRLSKRAIWVNDRAVMHISDVVLQAQRWKYEHDIKILFVDYLQRLKGGSPSAPKHERMEEVVQGLKQVAKELEIPVVALAQVNREVENRPNKRPMMSDLKDSGAIEQEADLVLLLYRDEVYNPDTEDVGVAEVIVAKNRHGPVGTIRLAWQAEYTKFDDLDTSLLEDDEERPGKVTGGA